MTVDIRATQPDFKLVSEECGSITLEDGSVIETRVILCDLSIWGKDLLGYQFAVSTVVAIRVKALQKVKSLVKDVPLSQPGIQIQIPLTEEAGYEKMKIKKVDKPTTSSYSFDGKKIHNELQIHAVVRNLNAKAPSGAPLYHVRWSVNSEIEEDSDS
ncbi:hypothetical protein ES703_91410 [subsurface metagenome]